MPRGERDTPRQVRLFEDRESLVLSDLLNHVFDKGIVITGSVVIGIADIDLLRLDLDIMIGSTEAALRRARERASTESSTDADVPVLPADDAE